MLPEDLAFCVRLRRLNVTMSEVVFAIADCSLPPERAATLADEFTAIADEFHARSHHQVVSAEPAMVDAPSESVARNLLEGP